MRKGTRSWRDWKLKICVCKLQIGQKTITQQAAERQIGRKTITQQAAERQIG